MSKPIKLTKNLCGSGIFHSECGKWTTNRHWMVLSNQTHIMKSTPLNKNASSRPYTSWTQNFRPGTTPASVTDLTINGSTALVEHGTSNIVAWIDPGYVQFLDLGRVWVNNETSAILVTAGGEPNIDKALAWVMPRTSPLEEQEKELLRGSIK